VFGDHDEVLLGPMNAPIDHAYARLLWPETETMRLARSPGMPDWKRGRKGGFEIAQIALEDVQTVPPPEGAPARFGFIGFVEASDYASWSDVSAHFAPILCRGGQNSRKPGLCAMSSSASAPPRAIRSLGPKPRWRWSRAASATWRSRWASAAWSRRAPGRPGPRRFGDCKGKTALLLAILGELGIEAEPVAVNSMIGDAIHERLR
jgi:hypothetical protein